MEEYFLLENTNLKKNWSMRREKYTIPFQFFKSQCGYLRRQKVDIIYVSRDFEILFNTNLREVV
jgi:hypothetical protein